MLWHFRTSEKVPSPFFPSSRYSAKMVQNISSFKCHTPSHTQQKIQQECLQLFLMRCRGHTRTVYCMQQCTSARAQSNVFFFFFFFFAVSLFIRQELGSGGWCECTKKNLILVELAQRMAKSHCVGFWFVGFLRGPQFNFQWVVFALRIFHPHSFRFTIRRAHRIELKIVRYPQSAPRKLNKIVQIDANFSGKLRKASEDTSIFSHFLEKVANVFGGYVWCPTRPFCDFSHGLCHPSRHEPRTQVKSLPIDVPPLTNRPWCTPKKLPWQKSSFTPANTAYTVTNPCCE